MLEVYIKPKQGLDSVVSLLYFFLICARVYFIILSAKIYMKPKKKKLTFNYISIIPIHKSVFLIGPHEKIIKKYLFFCWFMFSTQYYNSMNLFRTLVQFY